MCDDRLLACPTKGHCALVSLGLLGMGSDHEKLQPTFIECPLCYGHITNALYKLILSFILHN